MKSFTAFVLVASIANPAFSSTFEKQNTHHDQLAYCSGIMYGLGFYMQKEGRDVEADSFIKESKNFILTAIKDSPKSNHNRPSEEGLDVAMVWATKATDKTESKAFNDEVGKCRKIL